MDKVSEKNKWADPLLHAVAAVLLVGLGAAMGAAWQAAILQTIFWFSREVEQDVAKKKAAGEKIWPVWPVRFSSQKWIEFAVPVVVGFIVAMVV